MYFKETNKITIPKRSLILNKSNVETSNLI